MGCWGYEPFDNDGAADMVAGLWEPVRKLKASGNRASAYYDEARAAIELATVAAGTDILGGPSSLQLGIDALDRMLADEKWIGSAREPEELRASILRQRRRVVRAMNGPRSKTLQKLFGTRKATKPKRARLVIKGKRVKMKRTTTTCAVVVRVNSKVCGQVALPPHATEEVALGAVAEDRLIGEMISEQIRAGKRQKKFLYVPGKIISITFS